MSGSEHKLKEFDGERSNWKNFKKRCDGFKKVHDEQYDHYDGIPRPSTRARITTAYTVDDDDNNDPTGAEPGDRVLAENPAQFTKKDKAWLKTDNKWFHILRNKLNGKAEELADELDEDSGILLEKTLEKHYEQQSNAHAAHKLNYGSTRRRNLTKQWALSRPNGTKITKISRQI